MGTKDEMVDWDQVVVNVGGFVVVVVVVLMNCL